MADEILKEIIRQMKSQDRDFRLYGAKFVKMKPNKLRIHMKRGTKVRNLDVELNSMDLYDIDDHTFSTSLKAKEGFMNVKTKTHKGIYFDQFAEILEGKI